MRPARWLASCGAGPRGPKVTAGGFVFRLKVFAAVAALAPLIAACGAVPPPPESRAAYAAARAAAEAGDYPAATDRYEALRRDLTRGRDAAALRLEYALVLLYADQPERARAMAAEAAEVHRGRDTRARAQVLSAIARHSLLETYLATRPPYLEARSRARAVYQDMVETYRAHGVQDEAGIIPARLGVLRESLAQIELREMRADIARGDRLTASQRAQYIQIEFGDTAIVGRSASELRRVVQQQA